MDVVIKVVITVVISLIFTHSLRSSNPVWGFAGLCLAAGFALYCTLANMAWLWPVIALGLAVELALVAKVARGAGNVDWPEACRRNTTHLERMDGV